MKTIVKLLPLLLFVLCIGCSSDSDSPQPPLYWEKISAGDMHTLAVRSDGTLWAWGSNAFGQLGDGTFDDRLSPVQIGEDNDWKEVIAGTHHSMALKTNGKLWAWGGNGAGQIGNGTYESQNVPIAIGNDTWKQITLGDLFSVGLRSDGTIWAWGGNFWGQVGVSDEPVNYPTPQQVGTGNDWKQVAAGSHHTLAQKANGDLWGWGSSLGGQLFVIENDNQFSPVPITSVAQHNWSMLAAGSQSLALEPNGKLFGWGSNFLGELSNPAIPDTADLIYMLGNDHWQMIEASVGVSAGIKTNGTLWIWGNNDEGQLGFGDTAVYNVQTQLGTANNWKFVTTGAYHGLALNQDNELWSWGRPDSIGNGADAGTGTPVLIPCPQ